jgi:drug/metabolite transporter (DMT)-like permease
MIRIFDKTLSQKGAYKQELPPHPPISAMLLAASLSVAFGANAVSIKMSLSGLGPFTNAGLRFALASATLFIFARLTNRSFKITHGQRWNLICLTLLFVLQFSLMYLGIDKSNASRATLLFNLQPFFVLFLAHFLIPGDYMTTRKFFALALGFGGVAFVFFEKKGMGSDFRTGDLMMLLATLIWAFRTVYMKKIIHVFGTYQLVLYPMMLSVPFFFAEGFLWDKSMVAQLDAVIIGALLYQGLLMASFGFLGLNYLLSKYGAVWVNSFNFVMPVTGVLLGALLLSEPITAKIWLALIFVMGGIIVIQIKNQ